MALDFNNVNTKVLLVAAIALVLIVAVVAAFALSNDDEGPSVYTMEVGTEDSVSAEVFEQNSVFKTDDYKWIFHKDTGDGLPEGTDTIDLSITGGSGAPTGFNAPVGAAVYTMDFGYSGTLPHTATVEYMVGTEFAGKNMSLFHVTDSDTSDMQQRVTVGSDGIAEITIDSCSSYVLIERPLVSLVSSDGVTLSFIGVDGTEALFDYGSDVSVSVQVPSTVSGDVIVMAGGVVIESDSDVYLIADVVKDVTVTVDVVAPDVPDVPDTPVVPDIPDVTLYTVTYMGNGGEYNGETQFVDETMYAGTCMFEYPGYTFTGWNTMADGNGTDYAIESVVGSNITLYAQWQQQVPRDALSILNDFISGYDCDLGTLVVDSYSDSEDADAEAGDDTNGMTVSVQIEDVALANTVYNSMVAMMEEISAAMEMFGQMGGTYAEYTDDVSGYDHSFIWYAGVNMAGSSVSGFGFVGIVDDVIVTITMYSEGGVFITLDDGREAALELAQAI